MEKQIALRAVLIRSDLEAKCRKRNRQWKIGFRKRLDSESIRFKVCLSSPVTSQCTLTSPYFQGFSYLLSTTNDSCLKGDWEQVLLLSWPGLHCSRSTCFSDRRRDSGHSAAALPTVLKGQGWARVAYVHGEQGASAGELQSEVLKSAQFLCPPSTMCFDVHTLSSLARLAALIYFTLDSFSNCQWFTSSSSSCWAPSPGEGSCPLFCLCSAVFVWCCDHYC